MKKRFLASLLSLVMLLTLLPVSAFAANLQDVATGAAKSLTVTATKNTEGKLSLEVKGNEEPANPITTFSYALHNADVADSDALKLLLTGNNALTFTDVTDGTVNETISDETKTHVVVYTADESDNTKVGAWGCAEITGADDGQTPPAGDTGSLTLDDTDTNVTVAAV